MRAVVQRVSRAQVSVNGEVTGRIGRGLLVLLGVGREDTENDAIYLAQKIAGLRVFEDDAGKMNRSLNDLGGCVLAISQFTLYGDVRRGKRPPSTPPHLGKKRENCTNSSSSKSAPLACAAKPAASKHPCK